MRLLVDVAAAPSAGVAGAAAVVGSDAAGSAGVASPAMQSKGGEGN